MASFRTAVLTACVGASALVSAQNFTVGETRHSVQNDNVFIDSGIDMQLDSSSDFYLNGFNVVGGASWNDDISLVFDGSYWDFLNSTYGTYNLGDLISGTQSWFFGGFFGGMLNINLNAPVPLGTYTTTIELLGGSTASSMDVLSSFEETIDVVDFGLQLSSPDTNIVLAPLGSTVIRHRLQNTSNTAFEIGSRYYGWSMDGSDQFDFSFTASYPAVMDPGSDQTVEHMNVTAHADFTTPFTLSSGIIGGWYSDDAVWLQAGEHTLTPVPEPSAIIGLGAAIAALAARRRRRA